MSIDDFIFLYFNLLNGGCASMQSIYLVIHLFIFLSFLYFFTLCMKYVFCEIIRILSFFLFLYLCPVSSGNDKVNSSMVILVMDDTVDTIGHFLDKKKMINT